MRHCLGTTQNKEALMLSPACLLLEPGNRFGRTRRFHSDFVFRAHVPILFFFTAELQDAHFPL